MPVRRFLCLFWRKTHTKGLRTIFTTTPEEDEGRKVLDSTEVDRTDQSIEQGSRQKSGEADSQEKEAEQRRGENRAVSGTDQSIEQGSRHKRPGQRTGRSAGENRRLLG